MLFTIKHERGSNLRYFAFWYHFNQFDGRSGAGFKSYLAHAVFFRFIKSFNSNSSHSMYHNKKDIALFLNI